MKLIAEFPVDDLDVERLMQRWRWLCPNAVALVARNAFGDLFLRNEHGRILRLDVAAGKLTEVAESESQFRDDLLKDPAKREEWLAQTDALAAAERGCGQLRLSVSASKSRSCSLRAARPTTHM